MLRILGYVALILVPLFLLFGIVLAVGVALFGIAVLRSDVFALFAAAFVAFAVATSVTASLWLARAKSAPHPEEPSS